MTLQKYREQLPTEIVVLRDYVLLSREKLKAYRVKLAACPRLDAVQAIRDQTLEEGQQIAEEVLYAEARFGELLDLSLRDDKSRYSPEKKLPDGISLNMSSQCQKLARHPDIVERVAAKAKKEERLVTRREVLREINMVERPNPGQAPPLPAGKYSVIYADPPWRYDAGSINTERAIENHYPTLDLDDIKALPVAGMEQLGPVNLGLCLRILTKTAGLYPCTPSGSLPADLPQGHDLPSHYRKAAPLQAILGGPGVEFQSSLTVHLYPFL